MELVDTLIFQNILSRIQFRIRYICSKLVIVYLNSGDIIHCMMLNANLTHH